MGAAEDVLRQAVREELELTSDGRRVWEAVIVLSRSHTTARRFFPVLSAQPPTSVLARFQRRGVPTPKQLLARCRLVRAAFRYWEEPGGVAGAAYALECSSPQALARMIRRQTGMCGSEWLRSHGPAVVEADFRLWLAGQAERWLGFWPLTPSRHTLDRLYRAERQVA